MRCWHFWRERCFTHKQCNYCHDAETMRLIQDWVERNKK